MQLTKHWAGQLDDYVIDLGWSPDGTQLAAASAAGPISLFAARDGRKHHELPGHENGTNVLAWMPGRTTTRDVRSPESGLPTPVSDLASAPSAPAILATGGQDGAVKFWDALAGQHTATASLGSAWIDHLTWRSLASDSAGLDIQQRNSALVFA